MTKEFAARRLDIRAFAEEGAHLHGEEELRRHVRLMAETQGRGGETLLHWSASGELRNPRHVNPEVWVHLQAQAILSLVCQRCLTPMDVQISVDRSFRFVPDEEMAAAQDEHAEEDVLALSRSFDLLELVEDELLMELPLAPRHEACPQPVRLQAEDEAFAAAVAERRNPFAMLGKLKTGKS